MALKPCRECGEKVSTFAAACPKCGKKHPTTGTTEYIVAFAVIVVVIGCFAISGSADQQQPQPDLPRIGSKQPVINEVPACADEKTFDRIVEYRREKEKKLLKGNCGAV